MTVQVNTGNDSTLLNQKQLAEALGVSAPYLSRLTKEGRIPYADAERKLYDLEEVRAALRKTADVRQVLATETRRNTRDVQPGGPAPGEVDAASAHLGDEEEPEYGLDHHENFKIAASFEKREAARIARIERMKLEGSVVVLADVEREAYTEARIIRDTLLGALPTKLAPSLAAITDPFAVEQALREGLREALHDIVRKVEEGLHGAG